MSSPEQPPAPRDEAVTSANARARSLRTGSRAARGAATLVSARVALWGLALVQSVVVARAVAPPDLGLYATALAVVALVSRLKQVGSPEKLVRDPDEELPASLSAALAVESTLGAAAMVLVTLGAALIPWHGAEPRERVVIAVVGVLVLQGVAELPSALFHRRLEFRRLAVRRLLAAAATVVATIAAALLGLQIWSLVLGQVVAVVAGAVFFWRGVDPRPTFRVEPAGIRSYLAFGAPLWGSGLLYALAERGSVLVVSSVLGLGTLGYVHLAQALTLRLNQVNDATNAAIYPVLRTTNPVALRDVLERTNRVFALGGVLAGVALGLFAAEWVPLFFGKAWAPAVPFVSVYCLTWGFSAIGYPCHLAFQVRGDTRTLSLFGSAAFLGRFVAIFLGVVLFGEAGLLISLVGGAAMNVAARMAMIRRLFPDLSLLALSAPAVSVGVVAAAATGLIGSLLAGGGPVPLVRLLVFVAAAIAGAFAFDRRTLSDAAAQVIGALGVAPR